jgi:GNAT superfamily N-acetyltransferase
VPLNRLPFRTFRGQRGTFIRVTEENWHAVKKRVLELERRSFIPSIRESDRSLTKIALSPSAIFLVAAVGDTLTAYAMADRLERFGGIPGTRRDPHYGRRDTIYISSVAVDPEWRGRGIGVGLERELVRVAYDQGYSRVTAHIRGSARLGDQLSRRVLDSFPNWYETGESFDYVVLDLGEVSRKAAVRARG